MFGLVRVAELTKILCFPFIQVSIQLENLPTETNPVLESAPDLGNQSTITGMDDPLSENQGDSTDLMEGETETKNISDAAADIVDDDANMETEIKGKHLETSIHARFIHS